MSNTKYPFQQHLLNTLKVVIGIMFATLGTALHYQVNWGSSPNATFGQGLSRFFNISLGTSNLLINCAFLIVILIFERNLLGIGTILPPLVFSLTINPWMTFLDYFHIAQASFALKILILILGAVCSGIGFGYYVAQNYGIGAIDSMSIILNHKLSIPFVYARWGMDIAMTISGIFLGASWGLGTVIAVILVSPVMNFIINMVKKRNLSKQN